MKLPQSSLNEQQKQKGEFVGVLLHKKRTKSKSLILLLDFHIELLIAITADNDLFMSTR